MTPVCRVTLLALAAVLLAACPKREEPETAPANGDQAGEPQTQTEAAQVSGIDGEWQRLDTWWGEGTDPHRQGFTWHTGPVKPAVRWTCDLGLQFTGKLGLDSQGVIYASLADVISREALPAIPDVLDPEASRVNPPCAIVAVSPRGEEKWRQAFVGAVDFAVALVPDTRIYVKHYVNSLTQVYSEIYAREADYLDLSGQLEALDPTGNTLWSVDTRGAWLGAPAVDLDGTVFGAVIYAVDLEHGKQDLKAELWAIHADGRPRWHNRLPRLTWFDELPPAAEVVLGPGDELCLGWTGNTICAYSVEGSRRWTLDLRVKPDAAIAIAPDGTPIALAGDRPDLSEKQLEYMSWEAMNKYGVCFALRQGGAVRWSLQAGSDVHSAPAVGADGSVTLCTTLFRQKERTTYEGYGRVYRLGPSGKLGWSFDTRAAFADYPVQPSPLIDASGTLYVADTGTHLYALAADGTLKWEFEAPGGFTTAPVIASDGTLYIGSGHGTLYALGNPP